jgi:ubiquitin carboxyl-terminal hydrolase 9/13
MLRSYCNSIVQALYFSESFRDNVIHYPPSETSDGQPPKVNVQIRPPMAITATQAQKKEKVTASQALKQRQAINTGQVPPGQPVRPEDKPDSPEYKKKQAMIKGPVLELAQGETNAYDMQECTFTGLKDIFMAMRQANTRTGVLSPQRFLEIFKRDNEMFRNSMHQDAHEFYGIVLNDVISNVEANAKRLQEKEETKHANGLVKSVESALGVAGALQPRSGLGTRSPGTGWVHDIFEGVLTSETKCLTCETTSQREETFLDLSIDLEEHSSVTSCLGKFSAEEMLCERNKFHCDHCGGLQEAEKRMKIKRLPKVLALHLKRFKYTEDYSRLQKLFHRVVYPYHLRMFNTTNDADDPDRLYELYAVVVHIGGNAYHGHYVSIIKTKDRGWLLFDDEMVEPVDKHFVRNFFGDKPGMACAYVLFYQETTFEQVLAEQEAEGLEEVKLASATADLASENEPGNGVRLSKHITQPQSPSQDHAQLPSLDHAQTAPDAIPPVPVQPVQAESHNHPLVAAPPPAPAVMTKSDVPAVKSDPKEDKKELKAQEKARKAAEKEQAKAEEKQRKEREARARDARKNEQDELRKVMEASKRMAEEEDRKRKAEAGKENAASPAIPAVQAAPSTPAAENGGSVRDSGFLSRSNKNSKSISRKSLSGLLGRDKEADKNAPNTPTVPSDANANGNGSNGQAAGGEKLKERFKFGIGKKKSSNVL